jgi:hypothetical protein
MALGRRSKRWPLSRAPTSTTPRRAAAAAGLPWAAFFFWGVIFNRAPALLRHSVCVLALGADSTGEGSAGLGCLGSGQAHLGDLGERMTVKTHHLNLR